MPVMTTSSDESLNQLRHSAAHLLAAAVLKLFPKVKNAIGPAIDDGFYQDFDSTITYWVCDNAHVVTQELGV